MFGSQQITAMKKKDVKQLKNADVAELKKRVREAQERLHDLEKNIGLGKHKNVHEAKSVRKDIARMLGETKSRAASEIKEAK
jgi:ribosomal protein L29